MGVAPSERGALVAVVLLRVLAQPVGQRRLERNNVRPRFLHVDAASTGADAYVHAFISRPRRGQRGSSAPRALPVGPR